MVERAGLVPVALSPLTADLRDLPFALLAEREQVAVDEVGMRGGKAVRQARREERCHTSVGRPVMSGVRSPTLNRINTEGTTIMKLVIIGGTGLIGSKLVAGLREGGHDAVAAAPNTGVNSLTGEGLAEALQGASVVVDVSNSPSFEDTAVMEFFTTCTRNLLEACAQPASRTTWRSQSWEPSGWPRVATPPRQDCAGAADQGVVIPYSIVHATQFFEFVKSIAAAATEGETVRLAPVLIQPMAADDVAKAVGRIAVGTPVNGAVEVAGPDEFRLDELIREGLGAREDRREVVVDPQRSTSVPTSASARSCPPTAHGWARSTSRSGSASRCPSIDSPDQGDARASGRAGRRARQHVAGELPATRYSYRKAIIGSTRLARRAGR